MMRKHIFFLFGLIVSSYSFSQNELDPNNFRTVKVSLKDKTISKPLPSDEHFKIELEVLPGTRLMGVAHLYETFVYRDRCSRIPDKTRDLIPKGSSATTVAPFETLDIVKNESKKNSYTIHVPPLHPNKLYDIAIMHNLTNKDLKLLFESISFIRSGNDLKAKDKYEKFFNPKENQPYKRPRKFLVMKFDDFKTTFYQTSLKAYFDKLGTSSNFSETKITSSDSIFQLVAQKLKLNDISYSEFASFYKLIYDQNELDKLLMGLTSIGETSEISKHELFKRQQRLQGSLDSINRVTKILLELHLIDNAQEVKDYYDFFEKLQKKILKNKELISKEIDNIKKAFDSNLNYGEWLSVSTATSDIEVSSGKRLVPDFGLANLLMYSSHFDGNLGNGMTYIPRPYIGLNIHFRPINKDQRFNSMTNLSFKHRSSLSIGLSIGKIDTQRYSDFYTGMSLLVGYNYRIAENIRIGTGVSILRQEDPNPIISNKQIVLGGYVNLSFDFRLFNSFGKLVTKLIS